MNSRSSPNFQYPQGSLNTPSKLPWKLLKSSGSILCSFAKSGETVLTRGVPNCKPVKFHLRCYISMVGLLEPREFGEQSSRVWEYRGGSGGEGGGGVSAEV